MKINITIIVLFICGIFSAQKIWSFNDCLNYAKENNLQVIASRLNEQVTEDNYKIAKKEKLPDFIGNINNSVTFAPKTKFSVLGIRDDKYSGAYAHDLSVSSSILLYNNGRLKINEEKSGLLAQKNKFATEKIQKDISLQLVGNYLTVLLNKELQGVEKNSLDNNQQQEDRNQKLYDAGSIAKSTLYESKANLATAKQRYENAIIEVDRSLMTLAMLLQKDYQDFVIEEVKISDDISIPLFNVDEVTQSAYVSQPEIKSSELSIEASQKDIELAKTALYPTITGGYKAGTAYSNLFDFKDKTLGKQWYDGHDHIFNVGVSIPIFNKGISKIKIEQSKIQKQIQENDLDQQKLTLKQAIQTSFFDVNSAYQTYLSAKESVEFTKISYEFAQKSFNAGKLNIYDLNIARNNYYNALSQMLQAKYTFIFRQKILDYYSGKSLEISDEGANTAERGVISSSIISQDNQRLSSDTELGNGNVQNIEEVKETLNRKKKEQSQEEESPAENNEDKQLEKEGSVEISDKPEEKELLGQEIMQTDENTKLEPKKERKGKKNTKQPKQKVEKQISEVESDPEKVSGEKIINNDAEVIQSQDKTEAVKVENNSQKDLKPINDFQRQEADVELSDEEKKRREAIFKLREKRKELQMRNNVGTNVIQSKRKSKK